MCGNHSHGNRCTAYGVKHGDPLSPSIVLWVNPSWVLKLAPGKLFVLQEFSGQRSGSDVVR
jgi:hypothetical protein